MANIRVNHRRGMEKLIAYLYSHGHRRMGFVGFPPLIANECLGSSAGRKGVLLRSSRETAADEDTLEGGRRAARMVLAANPAITALRFAQTNAMARGSLREVREQKTRAPDDISVTGFDDVKLAQFSYLPLTSVHISREEIGRIVCDCLFGAGEFGTARVRDRSELVLALQPDRRPGALAATFELNNHDQD